VLQSSAKWCKFGASKLARDGAWKWRPFVGRVGDFSDAPKEAVDELTQAFRDMSHDPEYRKALAQQTGGYPIIVGQKVLTPLVKQTFDIDPSVREWLFSWLEQKYSIPRPRNAVHRRRIRLIIGRP